jgi:hypothetical protein
LDLLQVAVEVVHLQEQLAPIKRISIYEHGLSQTGGMEPHKLLSLSAQVLLYLEVFRATAPQH